MNDVAWAPDGKRLVAVTGSLFSGGGAVVEVKNNNSLAVVCQSKHGVRTDPDRLYVADLLSRLVDAHSVLTGSSPSVDQTIP